MRLFDVPRFTRQLITVLVAVLAVIVMGASVTRAQGADAERNSLTVYIFWQEGCPYCASAKRELATLAKGNQAIRLEAIELGKDAIADALFENVLAFFRYDRAAVPLVIIGDRSFLGYMDDGRSTVEYRDAASQCLDHPCRNVIAEISDKFQNTDATRSNIDPASGHKASDRLPDVINIPLIGEMRTRDLSLPALTVLLAAIDGFNPCAMWVLVFLIGLLLGLKDEKRMWILGGAFLTATAVMYFAVMAAWLNLLLFLGAVVWVRTAIGVLSVCGGVYFLREYWTKPEGVCRVTNPTRRHRIMDSFRAVVSGNQLIISIIGIIALAVLVNLIELLCSAGIPAVYTQVLSLNDLPVGAYYLYLALYIAVFMLDDVAIFATAMFALRVAGLTGGYARVSHLVGGFVLLTLGAIMILRPDLLSFT